MSDIEKISDKSKYPSDRKQVEKKEIDPKKFRRYVDKVSETDPEEQKRRKLPGEDEGYVQKSERPKSNQHIKRRMGEEEEESGDYSKKSLDGKGKDRTFETKGPQRPSIRPDEDQSTTEKSKIKGEKVEEILSPLEIAAIKKEKKKENISTKSKLKLAKEAPKKIEEESQEKAEGTKKETKKEDAFEKVQRLKAEEEQGLVEKKDKSVFAKEIQKEKQEKAKEKEKKEIQKAQIEGLQEKTVQSANQIHTEQTSAMHHIPALQNPQILKMFSHMVSQITMVVQRGETDVTITLGGAAFENSVFAGSQIVIKQSESAPNTYNLELYGATNEAQALFDEHSEELLDAFQYNQYPFKIQRVTTSKTKKKHLIERKKEKGEGEM